MDMDRYEEALAKAREILSTRGRNHGIRRVLEEIFPEIKPEPKPASLMQKMASLGINETITIPDSASSRNTAQQYASTMRRYGVADIKVHRDGNELQITRVR